MVDEVSQGWELSPAVNRLLHNTAAQLTAAAAIEKVLSTEGLTVAGLGGICRPHPLLTALTNLRSGAASGLQKIHSALG